MFLKVFSFLDWVGNNLKRKPNINSFTDFIKKKKTLKQLKIGIKLTNKIE